MITVTFDEVKLCVSGDGQTIRVSQMSQLESFVSQGLDLPQVLFVSPREEWGRVRGLWQQWLLPVGRQPGHGKWGKLNPTLAIYWAYPRPQRGLGGMSSQ